MKPPKRIKRRAAREAELGPEMKIVSTSEGYHTLECGHVVSIHPTERPHNKSRRCIICKTPCGAV